jgi:hypothetical protein
MDSELGPALRMRLPTETFIPLALRSRVGCPSRLPLACLDHIEFFLAMSFVGYSGNQKGSSYDIWCSKGGRLIGSRGY